jgi:EAL domain-containing protein (putative c-di-GMP-specific phosphodiesterase class I)
MNRSSALAVRPRTFSKEAALRLLAAFMGVALAAWLSRSLSPGEHFSLLWLPAGVAFALAWKYGYVMLLPVVGGMLFWGALAQPHNPWVGVTAASAEALAVLVAVTALRWLLKVRRWRGMGSEHGRLRWLLNFYLATLLIGALLPALMGALIFKLSGQFGSLAFGELAFVYWVIQALGVLLFAPLILSLLGSAESDANPIPFPPGFSELRITVIDALAGLAVIALAAVIFWLRRSGNDAYVTIVALAYLPLVAFSAMTQGARFNYLILTLAAVLMSLALVLTSDPIGSGRPTEPALRKEVFETLVLIFCGTLLAQILQAISSDRARALARLEDQAMREPVTGLFNEFGFGRWLDARDSQRAWLLVAVWFGSQERIGFLLGPANILSARRQLARQLDAYQPHMLATTEPGRYLLAFPDDARGHDTVDAMFIALKRHQVPRENGDMIDMPGRVTVVRLPPGGGGSATLMTSTLMALEAQTAPVNAQRPPRHDLTDDLLYRLADIASRSERVRTWINEGRIVLFAQPIAPARPASAEDPLLAFEILARLRDDQEQLLPPGVFLSIAAELGMMAQIDRVVVAAVFDYFRKHPEQLARVRKCAINMSSASLADPGFVGFVKTALSERGLSARHFCFEITESQAIASPQLAQSTVSLLRAAGFAVSIDDFGTGFATYDYLKRFAVDEIKIDGSFITGLTNPNTTNYSVTSLGLDEEIIASIVRIAHRLNIRTVAECVGDEAVRKQVAALGVDYVQGWCVGRPMPLAQLFETSHA